MKNRQMKWISKFLILLLIIGLTTPTIEAKQNNNIKMTSEELSAMKYKILKQRELAKTKKIDKTINLKSSDIINVIVEFNEVPQAVQEHKAKQSKKAFQANAHKEKLSIERSNFKNHLVKKGIKAQFGRSFEKVFNGVVLEVKANEIPKLAEDPNVKSIYKNNKINAIPIAPAAKNVPYMQDSAPLIGADQYWDLGFEGEGKKIGVIDTGVDYNHPDLKDAFKGGYDFVDNDSDPFEGDDGKQKIESEHGTHVSGIIAGRGTYELGGVRGIAPKSDLYVYRVLGPNGGWDEWVIAGIEKAVEDDMDVINLSLGNGINDPDQPTSRAVNNAMLAGVVSVVANGNTGEFGYSTVAAPATAALAISVGASTPPIREIKYKAKASATEEEKEYTLNWMMKWEAEGIDVLKQPNEIVYMGFGTEKEFSGKNLEGKIALIKRGGSFFHEANERAKNAGAKAVIFFNQDGLNEHIDHPFPSDGPLPMFDMRGDDGHELVEKMKETISADTFTFTDESIDLYPGDEIAGFSSKGPVIGTWDVKPDLVAPGVNIRSTVPSTTGSYDKAYQRYSGTSMAAPHIAGLAALILESRPKLEVFDVKTALMNTSKTIAPLSGITEYNVQQIGAGRVQAMKALQTPVLAQVYETTSYTKDPLGKTNEEEISHITGSINFGPLKEEEEVSKKITLKDISGLETTYEVSYELKYTHDLKYSEEYPRNPNEPVKATLQVNKQKVTVPAGGTTDVNLSLLIPAESNDGYYEGYIYLKPTSGDQPALQLPFMGYNNPKLVNAISYFDPNPKFLSLNGDGVDEITNIETKFLLNMKKVELYLYSETDWDIYGFVKSLEGDDLKKGIHSIAWNGSYWNLNNKQQEIAKSGLYYLVLVGEDEFGNETYYDVPFIVSSEKTDILVDDEIVNSTGQKSVLIRENMLHGTITSAAVQIYRDFLFHVSYPYYWNMIKMEYELYDTKNQLLSEGDVFTFKEEDTPEKHIEYYLKDIFPNGESRLVLRVSDKAGNVNEQSYLVNYAQDTEVGFKGANEVSVGEPYEITLQSNQVQDMIGSEYIVSYPSKAFTVQQVVPVPGFKAETLSYEKIKTFRDENGVEYTTIKVISDLRKNPKEHKKPKKDMVALNGNVQTAKIIFNASKNIDDIGKHLFKAEKSLYTNTNLEKMQLLETEKEVELFTQSGSFSGFIKPEALLDENGQNRSDINYSKEGVTLKVYNSKEGYGMEGARNLGPLDGYREDLGWYVESDGSFKIYGLNPKEKYDIVITYPSHFTGVIKGVQPVKEVGGRKVPAEVNADFGILKAGYVVNKGSFKEEINIYDVALVARHQGKKAVKGEFEMASKVFDVDSDGQINNRDLSFPIKNFGLKNMLQEQARPVVLEEEPPTEPLATIELNTQAMSVKKGDIIPVTVDLKNTSQIYALQYAFNFDPTVLELVDEQGNPVSEGKIGFFKEESILLKNHLETGRIEFAASHKGDASTLLKDEGTAVTYYFKALKDDSRGATLTWDHSAVTIISEAYGTVAEKWQKSLKDLTIE